MYNRTNVGKYECQKLFMGVCNSPDIFQENISKLFKGFDMVHSCIYGVKIITKHYFKDHLTALDKVLKRLTEGVLIVNAGKSLFGQIET